MWCASRILKQCSQRNTFRGWTQRNTASSWQQQSIKHVDGAWRWIVWQTKEKMCNKQMNIHDENSAAISRVSVAHSCCNFEAHVKLRFIFHVAPKAHIKYMCILFRKCRILPHEYASVFILFQLRRRVPPSRFLSFSQIYVYFWLIYTAHRIPLH